MVIERFSSRREALGDVLTTRLAGATRYLRIAGYFRSSLVEVVGEALEGVGEIRVVCNGDLDPYDVKVAKAAREGQQALAQTLVSSWQSTEDGLDLLLARERYRRLHDLLATGRMKVRVVPRDADNVFVHGKAGIIERPDGRTYSFVGSVFAPTADGETIPISLLHRRGHALSGTTPCLLYGYGAYGISIPAAFDTNRLSLVDRGFVSAIAHVRGGSEKGWCWYREGKLAKKMNTFSDFIAVSEYLVKQGWAAGGSLDPMIAGPEGGPSSDMQRYEG